MKYDLKGMVSSVHWHRNNRRKGVTDQTGCTARMCHGLMFLRKETWVCLHSSAENRSTFSPKLPKYKSKPLTIQWVFQDRSKGHYLPVCLSYSPIRSIYSSLLRCWICSHRTYGCLQPLVVHGHWRASRPDAVLKETVFLNRLYCI